MSAAATVFDTNDRRLTANDVGQIENGDEAIRFFARLGYDVDDAVPVAHSTLGLDTDNLQLEIKQLQRIAADPDLGDIVVYLMQVRAVTVTLVQAITHKFRTRPELALRAYAHRAFVNADESIFGSSGVAGLIAEETNLELRNRAAHDTVLTREDALQARARALGILRLL